MREAVWQTFRGGAGLGHIPLTMGSLPDPLNFIPLAGGFNLAMPGTKLLSRAGLKMLGRSALIGAGENAAGAAMSDAAAFPMANRWGADLGVKRAAEDVALAGALGSAFSAAGTSIGHMKAAKPNKVVSAETRKLLEERLMGAGRTMEEAAGAGGLHHSELSWEKRRKYEALTALEVSSKEIKSIRGPGEFTKRLVEWARGKGLFDKFTNLDSGMDNIEFNAASVRSVKQHNAGDRKLAILQAAPELIKHGVYLESTKRNEQGLISHVFAGKVKIDESENVVGFVIREDVNGRRYYDHRVVYLADKNTGREVEASRPSRPDQGVTPGKRVTDYDDIVTIVKKHLGVKPDATFEQPAFHGSQKDASGRGPHD